MDNRIEAIRTMWDLCQRFVAGKISFDVFYPALGQQFACFDPLDWTTADLTADLQAEVLFFSAWRGGEFGENAEMFPQAADWRYGISTDRYGWIDKEKYRQQLADGLRGLKQRDQ